MARGSPCRNQAQRMRLPSSFVSCSHQKTFGHDCGKGSPRADHDAEGSCVGLRRNCTHVRRRPEKVLTSAELFVGANSSSFANGFAHAPAKINVRVGTIDRPFLTKPIGVQF